MIDAFYIFTKGGLLLWSTQLVKVKGNPLDRLIKEVLLEERVGETSANLDSYSLKWKLLNEMDIFFVVVYQGILQLTYLEGLLASVAKEFVNRIGDAFGNGLQIKHVDFDADFKKVLQKADKDHLESKRPRAMKNFQEPKKSQAQQKSNGEKTVGGVPSKAKGKNDTDADADGNEEDDDEAAGAQPAAEDVNEARKKLMAKAKNGPTKKKDIKEEEPVSSEKKKGKVARHWDGAGKVNSATMAQLDHSKPANHNRDDEMDLKAKQAEFLGSGDEAELDEEVASLTSGSDDEGPDAQSGQKAASTGRMGGLFKTLTRGVKNLTGGATLAEEDLAPILQSFKMSLMAKNVGTDVAVKLADSVQASLVGKTTDRFTSMSSTVKSTLKESMETLLTPKKSIDVLRAALAAKNAGRVYTIVFLGVNGVGKSTNLAKVAYYLKNKGGLKVLICACDTFRAGAVEQLKTHARCLDIPLFERGYGKDPADIAKHAIAHAAQTSMDVVLVDTAGRMQDNEPFMRALSRLVNINNPDLVLFVGEALVGNDAIDQVSKFNRALIDMSPDPRKPRGIDGMLLTKYDTVDDKVGAALSMVYVTGQPIVFVGTGQKYPHLRKLQAKEVVRTLLG